MLKSTTFSGIGILCAQRAYIDFKGKFVRLVRKFEKLVVFDSCTFESAQALGNKRKNAYKRRFTLNGEALCEICELASLAFLIQICVYLCAEGISV